MAAEYLSLMPLITLFGFALVSLIFGGVKRTKIAIGWSAVGVALAIWQTLFGGYFNGAHLFDDTIIMDAFSQFFILLFLGVAFLILLAAPYEMKERPEFSALILIATIGMSGVALANDLLVLFVSWELMSITTYSLAALGKDKKSTEGGIKYYLYGIVASAFILYAISLLYGITGTTNLTGIVNFVSAHGELTLPVVGLSAFIFILGFGYKMGVVPFHMWIPDAYEGAPSVVAGLLAGGSKKASIAAMFRIIITALIVVNFGWTFTIAIIAVLTMTIGNFLALSEPKVSRMLAYSSITQVGYILIGLAVATTLGVAGALFQALTHAIMKSAAFIAAGVVFYKLSLKTMDDYNGLVKRMKFVSFALAIMLLSLAGVPPFAGFISKFILFASAVDAGLIWLAVIAVLNSAFSLGYYLRLIKNMFIEDAPEDATPVKVPYGVTISLALALILVIVIGIYPAPFYDYIIRAAQSIIP